MTNQQCSQVSDHCRIGHRGRQADWFAEFVRCGVCLRTSKAPADVGAEVFDQHEAPRLVFGAVHMASEVAPGCVIDCGE